MTFDATSLLGTDCASVWSAGGGCDLDPYFTPISGVLAVAHAVTRRLVTPRGSLSWDPAAGFDLKALLNEGIAKSLGLMHAVRSAIEAEAESDERVARADATIEFDEQSQSLTVTLACLTDAGPFTLVLGASTKNAKNELLLVDLIVNGSSA